jgi:hypothetical protein
MYPGAQMYSVRGSEVLRRAYEPLNSRTRKLRIRILILIRINIRIRSGSRTQWYRLQNDVHCAVDFEREGQVLPPHLSRALSRHHECMRICSAYVAHMITCVRTCACTCTEILIGHRGAFKGGYRPYRRRPARNPVTRHLLISPALAQ